MELTTHKLRISQSTVNTIFSRAQGHYKSILLSAGADEIGFFSLFPLAFRKVP